jgi:asparagine synthase (glutamine-hydrolysing)
LTVPGFIDDGKPENPFEDMLQFNQEGRSFDALNRSLYSDYQSVVHFYMMRMGLVRSFGIKPKFPLLDPDLIEFCASIPAKWKIRGFSDAKYIEKVALDTILPKEITHRRDKLGHSIPLKNWMRNESVVRELMCDILSEETIKRRGLVRSDVVQKMIRDHWDKKENHSHRLWALMVLELWLEYQKKSFHSKSNSKPMFQD